MSVNPGIEIISVNIVWWTGGEYGDAPHQVGRVGQVEKRVGDEGMEEEASRWNFWRRRLNQRDMSKINGGKGTRQKEDRSPLLSKGASRPAGESDKHKRSGSYTGKSDSRKKGIMKPDR